MNHPVLQYSLSKNMVTCIRFSIWLDSKLRLQTDPILILEYFLWRHGYEYAISNHYDRHCVWEEVAQNKKLNKFNHTIIDQQFEFYQADGLTRFNSSYPHKLLPSCMFSYLLVLVLVYELCWPKNYFSSLLQMSLKVLSSWGNTHRCPTYSLACGSMRLIASHLVTSSALHIHTWSLEEWILRSRFASICLRWVW